MSGSTTIVPVPICSASSNTCIPFIPFPQSAEKYSAGLSNVPCGVSTCIRAGKSFTPGGIMMTSLSSPQGVTTFVATFGILTAKSYSPSCVSPCVEGR